MNENFVTGRNLLSQKEIYISGKNIGINFVELGSISSKKISFLPQDEMYCHRRKFTVAGRNLMSKEEFFLSQEEFSCHRIKFDVTRRKFLPQEEIYCHRKDFC